MSELSDSRAKREAAFLDSILSENVRLGGFNLLTFPIVLITLRTGAPDDLERWVALIYAFFFAVSSVAYGVIVVHLMKKHRSHACYHAFTKEWREFSGESSPIFKKINAFWGGLFSVPGSAGHEIETLLPNLKTWRDLAFFPQIGMIVSFAVVLLLAILR